MTDVDYRKLAPLHFHNPSANIFALIKNCTCVLTDLWTVYFLIY